MIFDSHIKEVVRRTKEQKTKIAISQTIFS